MIKKPTLIVILCAVVLGGVYYLVQWRSQKAEKAAAEPYKPAFTVPAADITSLNITRPAKPEDPTIHLAKESGAWKITQPVDTGADSSVVDTSCDNLTSAKITQSEPYAVDRLKAYGLDPAKIAVEFQTKGGAKHTLLIGDKVFDGSSVYTIIDGAKSVSVLPDSVLTSTDKSLDDWRNHTVLHITSNQVPSFTLKNSSGDMALAKVKDQWTFSKPVDTRADGDSIDGLLTAVQNAKFTNVASEKPDDLAKYGLANPAVSLTATDDTGKKFTLEVGKKDGNDYFARDISRPMIFHVNSDLYTQLTKNFADLRDKKVFHVDAADLNRIEIHDDHGTLVADKSGDDWKIESPDAQKGKTAPSFKLVDPLTNLRADQVIDHAGGDITGKLAKPAIEITLTDKNKKTTTLRVSNPAGDNVYAQSSDSPAVFKLKKQDFDNLNLDPSSVVQ
ncbi:MAG TPA: DUF4340 domain-containing protein [Candidatus Acidoferrales bacterium]|jgi:hypothetical protein|nr:DUF4340 domain-containing protein [Candidatus Acidoferrales bacterium]